MHVRSAMLNHSPATRCTIAGLGVATVLALTACSSTADAGEGGSGVGGDQALNTGALEEVCSGAREAYDMLSNQGLTQRLYNRVQSVLDAGLGLTGEHVDITYYLSSVRSAHEGSAPELTLAPVLGDLITGCSIYGL